MRVSLAPMALLLALGLAAPPALAQTAMPAGQTRAKALIDRDVYSADDVAAHDRPRLTLGRTQFVTKAGVDLAGVEERVLQLLQTDSTRPKDGT